MKWAHFSFVAFIAGCILFQNSNVSANEPLDVTSGTQTVDLSITVNTLRVTRSLSQDPAPVLNVISSGSITTGSTFVGDGGPGTVNINGGTIINQSSTSIGGTAGSAYNPGSGVVNINSGGTFDTGYGLSVGSGRSGEINVTGEGSKLISSRTNVGHTAQGKVNVTDGATWSSREIEVKGGGIVNIKGEGSELIINKGNSFPTTLSKDSSRSGSLEVSDRASVSMEQNSWFFTNGKATIDNATVEMKEGSKLVMRDFYNSTNKTDEGVYLKNGSVLNGQGFIAGNVSIDSASKIIGDFQVSDTIASVYNTYSMRGYGNLNNSGLFETSESVVSEAYRQHSLGTLNLVINALEGVALTAESMTFDSNSFINVSFGDDLLNLEGLFFVELLSWETGIDGLDDLIFNDNIHFTDSNRWTFGDFQYQDNSFGVWVTGSDASAVPEPSTLLVFGIAGITGFAAHIRKRRRDRASASNYR